MEIAVERIIMRTAFVRACAVHAQWHDLSDESRTTLVRRMERSCHNVTIEECIVNGIDRLFTNIKFTQRYSANCFRVISNLRDNPDLLPKIIDDTINANDVGMMSSFELWPAASQSERDEIELRRNQKSTARVSTLYKCRKCGEKQTIPIEYQSRAADEMSTISMKCMNCGFTWRR